MFHNPDSVLVQEYAALGSPFVTPVAGTPLKTPAHLIHLNETLATELGLNATSLGSSEGVAVMAGNAPWPGYTSTASVYCGHQFGVYVPQLGDGRALLIAEVRKGAQYRQLQLKGAGPTPYSRHADGRAVLRSSIREYLASEAMHRLGIPSTRALALVGSSDPVFRETTETAAIVCRVSESFLRFGHAEFFCHSGQHDALREMLQWHIEQHHPDIELGDSPEDLSKGLMQWLRLVVSKTAALLAQWQAVGFCHGVMNTDNMSLLGLTIDYGPYGFVDAFDIDHTCNHSDHHGRYSYRNQPRIAHWNLYALAQAISPLLISSKEDIQNLLDEFAKEFHQNHRAVFMSKLGVPSSAPNDAQDLLLEHTLRFMHEHHLDFTRFFRSLCVLDPQADPGSNFAVWQGSPFFALALGDEAQLDAAKVWLEQWSALARLNRLAKAEWQQALRTINPAFVLRNHLLQTAIEKAENGSFEELNRLHAALSDPYSDELDVDLTAAPPDWAKGLVLSCSS